jgi:hypothetical protein
MSEDFFEGFTWAVPKAFSEAVKACRFEQGDILYDSQKAYAGEWDEAVKHINYSLQVRSPVRGTTASPSASGSVFGKNWDTEVTFELEDASGDEPKRFVETTQGRLFTALWHGDLSIFGEDGNPKPPLQLKAVSKNLEQAIPVSESFTGENPVFIMARDAANTPSILKHRKVSAILRSRFKVEINAMSPRMAGLVKWDKVAPTIEIVFFVMDTGSPVEIHDALKALLYAPAKDAKKDMFRLRAHGLLIPNE